MSKPRSTNNSKAEANRIEATLPFLEVPRDEDDWRFARSFRANEVDDLGAARLFFEEHGFCVFRDALSAAECVESRAEILSYIQRVSDGFDPRDQETWTNWRSKQFGMPTSDPSAFWQPQLSRNRRNPRVAACFGRLLGCAPQTLRCNHDRWALYRVGANTRRNLHLDINPVLYATNGVTAIRSQNAYSSHEDLYGGIETNLVSEGTGPHLQGTIALAPNEEQDAGFICVPGSHHAFEGWVQGIAAEGEAAPGARYDFPAHSPLYQLAQRVPVREGSLIVWDIRLAHGSTPDQSQQGRECSPRFVQFVTLRTQRLYDDKQGHRRAALVRRLFAANGLEEPVNPVERAVAGLHAGWVQGGAVQPPGPEMG